MLPRDTAKETVTVYNYVLTPEQGDVPAKHTYTRTVLENCAWQQDSAAAYKKTGVANIDDVTILTPYSPNYFSIQNGDMYTGDGWTVQIGPELIGTYFIRGECAFKFPLPVDVEDADFFHNYIKPFEKLHKYKRPKECIEHFVGSRGLWYLEVRC